jgi:4-carboxymuconolactone decarboxylase
VTSSTGPRLAAISEDRWDDDIRAALRTGGAALRSARVPNAVTTMMNHPSLAGSFLSYNAVLLNDSVLADRVRELMILRVAWRTGSTYEWLQHARIADRYTITAAEIDAVTIGATAPEWTTREADVLAATDQLMDRYCIDDETWERLSQHFDERQLVELVFVVGTYMCLAMAFNSFGVELDPELEQMTRVPRPGPAG